MADTDDASFRARDDRAAAELVQRYEPTIRLAVRVRDPALRRRFDSLDICQSVLGAFFVRVASGQFELDTPQQLVNLLVTTARNKLTNYALQQRAARRDLRRGQAGVPDAQAFPDPGPSPSQIASQQELHQFRSRLTAAERQLADWRAADRPWAELAAERGGSVGELRMRWTRAIDRAARALRLDE